MSLKTRIRRWRILKPKTKLESSLFPKAWPPPGDEVKVAGLGDTTKRFG